MHDVQDQNKQIKKPRAQAQQNKTDKKQRVASSKHLEKTHPFKGTARRQIAAVSTEMIKVRRPCDEKERK